MNILPKRSRHRQAGITLVETLIGAAVSSLLLAGLAVGAMTLQRQFDAATRYSTAQSDQIRALDYVEMDVRRATTVTVGNGTTPLTVTLPNYYQTVSGKKVPRDPTKAGTKVQYGTGSVTVTYALQGTRLVRTEGGVATTIASTVKAFPAPVRSGDALTVTLTFDSKLVRAGPAKDTSLTSKILLRNLN